jgi:hypothetical protein
VGAFYYFLGGENAMETDGSCLSYLDSKNIYNMEGLQMMIMNWAVNNKGHLTCGWNSLTEGKKVVADPKRKSII